MDVQKILAQAEQLLKRGKLQEAAEKFSSILQEDPQNEVAANKLALVYLDLEQKYKAIGIYCDIAKRASEKGKSNKALALYKQALVINENDPRVLKGLAEECEQLGKFSEASKYCESLIHYYQLRKRYLDVIDGCARLSRCSPENEQAKIIWLDVLKTLTDDTKLIHALVAFCGPPGLVSPDQQLGGDPRQISQNVLSKLVGLLDWFPVDPALPYSLAWVAYKNQNKLEAYKFLLESYRRDPDYCLSSILLARILVEEARLEEAQYVYKYAKEVAPRDRRTNIKQLSEQISQFEKNNGWLAFSEGLGNGGNLTAVNFLKKIRNEFVAGVDDDVVQEKTKTFAAIRPIAKEIKLTAEDFKEGENTNITQITTFTQTPEKPTTDIELPQDEQDMEVEFSNRESTNEQNPEAGGDDIGTPPGIPLPSKDLDDSFLLQDVKAPKIKEEELLEENTESKVMKTQVFSPQDMVNAAKWDRAIKADFGQKIALETEHVVEIPPPPHTIADSDQPIPKAPGPVPKITEMILEDNSSEQTLVITRPRIKLEPEILAYTPKEVTVNPPTNPKIVIEETKSKEKYLPGKVTIGLEGQEEAEAPTIIKAFTIEKSEIKDRIKQQATELLVKSSGVSTSMTDEVSELLNQDVTVVFRPVEQKNQELEIKLPPIPRFEKIEEKIKVDIDISHVDKGTDLLSLPAEFKSRDSDTVFVNKIDQLKNDIESLLRLSDEYFQNNDFYLSRKTCREALALGADEKIIKEKLKEIREKEFPEGIYVHFSSDDNAGVAFNDAAQVIRSLVKDFDINLDDDNPSFEMQKKAKEYRSSIEKQLSGCNPKIRIDIGVAFYEMGFYEEAENQFLNAACDEGETKFEAYYLAAQTMMARKNYRGAVNLLELILRESGKNEQDQLPIFYMLALSYEALDDDQNSRDYYLRVAKIDGNYRDVREKLK